LILFQCEVSEIQTEIRAAGDTRADEMKTYAKENPKKDNGVVIYQTKSGALELWKERKAMCKNCIFLSSNLWWMSMKNGNL
jgi:hypothetical protein